MSNLQCAMAHSLATSSEQHTYEAANVYAFETDRPGNLALVADPTLHVKFTLDRAEFAAGIDFSGAQTLNSPTDLDDDIFKYTTRSAVNLTTQQLRSMVWSTQSETQNVQFTDTITPSVGVIFPAINAGAGGNPYTQSIVITVAGNTGADATPPLPPTGLAGTIPELVWSIDGVPARTYEKLDNPYAADLIDHTTGFGVNAPAAPGSAANDIISTADPLLAGDIQEIVALNGVLFVSGGLDSIALTDDQVNDLVHLVVQDQSFNLFDTLTKVRAGVAAYPLAGLVSDQAVPAPAFSVDLRIDDKSSVAVQSNDVNSNGVDIFTWVVFN